MNDSKIERWGYSVVQDYYMSEKFGLNWKSYDHERMQMMWQIMLFENEREQKELKKSQKHGRQQARGLNRS